MSAVGVVLSPLVLYLAVSRFSLTHAALIVVAWIVLRTLPALLAASRDQLWAVAKLPLVAAVCALLGALTQARVLVLLLPSMTQLGFAWVFASSLRVGQRPLIEHFARMQKPELADEQVAYCRSVTKVWAGLMALAALIGAWLAAFGSAEAWAAWAFVLSYAVVAMLFAVEYLIRAFRFRVHRESALARLFARWIPPRP